MLLNTHMSLNRSGTFDAATARLSPHRCAEATRAFCLWLGFPCCANQLCTNREELTLSRKMPGITEKKTLPEPSVLPLTPAERKLRTSSRRVSTRTAAAEYKRTGNELSHSVQLAVHNVRKPWITLITFAWRFFPVISVRLDSRQSASFTRSLNIIAHWRE